MKLRDSFISIQHISNELNIPLASIECATRSTDIFPSDYELTNNGKVPAESNMPHEKTIIDSNIKIIDKATKANGMRVRNLKKSMLNDNKLLRLRDKLLRRSKSTVSLSIRPEQHTLNTPPSSLLDSETKEEYQNKENEQPRYNTIDYRAQIPQTPTKITSPNRNLVKMGTRVFSSQLLNKSYDNIFDSAGIDVYHFDDGFDDDRIVSASNTMSKPGRRNNKRGGKQMMTTTAIDVNDDGITDSSASGKKCMSSSTDAERLSLRSTSLSSLYFSEKLSERLYDSPAPNEAYVIRK